jgi:hypothetical protein
VRGGSCKVAPYSIVPSEVLGFCPGQSRHVAYDAFAAEKYGTFYLPEDSSSISIML